MTDAISQAAICVRFSLTRTEYQAAMLRLCWGLWFYRVLSALSALALGAGLILTVTGNPDLGLPTLAVGILWSVLTGLMLFVRPLLQYRRQPRLRAEQRHCFADDGITVSFPDAQSDVKWTFYRAVIELRDLYLIRHERQFANVIPKRAFDSRKTRCASGSWRNSM